MNLQSLPWCRASKVHYLIALGSATLLTGICWWCFFSFYKKTPSIDAYLLVAIFIFSANAILCFITNHTIGEKRRTKNDIAMGLSFLLFSEGFFTGLLLV